LKRVKTYYVFRRHNGTGMTIAIGIATYSDRHSASIGCSHRQA
jgi:hypothetical protein